MTPFSVALRTLRAKHELAQGAFADRLGYRQSYISALECGSKLPKDRELVRKIVQTLSLDDAEEATLQDAFEVSRHFSLPPQGAPAAAYRLCALFSEALQGLSAADAKALSAMLELILQRSHQPRTKARVAPGYAREIPM